MNVLLLLIFTWCMELIVCKSQDVPFQIIIMDDETGAILSSLSEDELNQLLQSELQTENKGTHQETVSFIHDDDGNKFTFPGSNLLHSSLLPTGANTNHDGTYGGSFMSQYAAEMKHYINRVTEIQEHIQDNFFSI
eukprot:163033_1